MGQTAIALVEGRLLALGLGGRPAGVLTRVAIVIVIVCFSLLANFLAKKIISTVVRRIVRKTRSRWDDIVYDRGVLNRLSHIAPALVVYFMNPLAFPEIVWLTAAIQRGSIAYMIAVAVRVIDAVLESVNDIYMAHSEQSRQRPIKGYIQLLKMLFYIVGLVLIVTTILDKSPVGILSGIGAMSAVLLLIFRDTILGLVAGVQLSTNRMIHIGDWIEMPKYGGRWGRD